MAWVVLLSLIIFTSSVWMHQTTNSALHASGTSPEGIQTVGNTLAVTIVIQIVLIISALMILFDIYSHTQKRERKTEIEKALAEDASRAKTSFLSNMSHEIRTPMNAIIGLDNIALRNPDLQPETRNQLEKIGVSARHLLGLINDILDMSRIESGRMALKSEEFSFHEFLSQINVIISGQCADKGLQYACNVATPMRDYYVGDDLKLKQVLINILGNAVKFTDAPGSVTLTVEHLEEKAADGSEKTCVLRFRIKDTGIGMDPEFLPKIFDSFSQADATATNRYGGSGLGMAISKNFVDMMNGTIQVESRKNAGTEFTVTVPLGRSDRVLVPETLKAPLLEDESILSGRRILIAEDVEQNAEILANLLELSGIETEHAENGEIAVRLFSEKPAGTYDAILMDVRMPVMDGLTATRTIRALNRPDAKAIPIIAMTANVFDEDVEHSLAAGMHAHLVKPVDPDLLMKTLAETIGKEEPPV